MILPQSPIVSGDPILTDYLRRIRTVINGNLSTENFASSITNSLTNGGEYSLIITAAGTMYADYIFMDGFYPAVKISIIKASVFAGTLPTGSSLTVDFLKNGVEQSKILTLATTASNHLQATTFTTALTYLPTDRLGMIVKTVGSTEAGRDLNITPNIKVI